MSKAALVIPEKDVTGPKLFTPVLPVGGGAQLVVPPADLSVYQTTSQKGQASGYASLDGTTKVPTAQLGTGSATNATYLRGDGTWQTPPVGTTINPGSSTSASRPDDSASQGTLPEYARTDHRHSREFWGGVAGEQSFGLASSAGSSPNISHSDHTHGTPADPVPPHVALADPHTQYQKESEKGVANGYAGLDSGASVLATGATLEQSGNTKLEIRSTTPTATPYIDLARTAADYDARIILTGDDMLRIDGASLNINTPSGLLINGVAHDGTGDPHPQYATDADLTSHTHTYQPTSAKDQPSGYAGLNASTKLAVGQMGTGTPSTSVFLRGDGSWAAVPGGSVAGGGTTASAPGDALSQGASPDFSRTDHRHSREAFGAVVAQTAFGAASNSGAAATLARSDHVHGTPTDPVTAHLAAANPHTAYQLASGREAANGYPGLDGNGFLDEPWRKAAAYPTSRHEAPLTVSQRAWTKIASGTLDTNNDMTTGMMLVTVADFQTPDTRRMATVRWVIASNAGITVQPGVVLEQVNGNFAADDLVIVVRSTNPIVYEFYVCLDSSWSLAWVSPVSYGVNNYNAFSGHPFNWHELQPLLTALPAGTVYTIKTAPSGIGWINVRDYGAMGDGINDDTAAIQNAIDAAGLAGSERIVFFPAGTYKITATLNITNHNVKLVGAGKGYYRNIGSDIFETVTRIVWGSATIATMINVDNGGRIGDVEITNLTLDGQGIAVPLLKMYGAWWGKFDVGLMKSGRSTTARPGAMYLVGCANNDIWVLGHGKNDAPVLYMNAGGDPTGGDNVCLNRIWSVTGYYGMNNRTGNDGVVFGDSDHNFLHYLWLFHETLGTDSGSTGTNDSNCFSLAFLGSLAGVINPSTGKPLKGRARRNVVYWHGGGAGGGDVNIWFQGGAKRTVDDPATVGETRFACTQNIVLNVDMQGGAANPTVGTNCASEGNRWFGDNYFFTQLASGTNPRDNPPGP